MQTLSTNAAALKGVRFTIDVNQALLAATAQQVYAVAKALARDRESAPLANHVANMKRALRAARRRRKRAPKVEEAQAKAD